MPGMDGLELLAKMREVGISVPAMIVTAYSDVPHAVQAMKLGAIDFLQKPLRPEDLRRIVSEILKRHAPQKEHPAESFNSHIVAAKRCLNLRSFAMARIHLAKALELNTKSVEAFNLAGVLAELLDDVDKAKKYYGQAIKLNKNYEPAQQNMRRLFELQNFGSTSEPLNLGGNLTVGRSRHRPMSSFLKGQSKQQYNMTDIIYIGVSILAVGILILFTWSCSKI